MLRISEEFEELIQSGVCEILFWAWGGKVGGTAGDKDESCAVFAVRAEIGSPWAAFDTFGLSGHSMSVTLAALQQPRAGLACPGHCPAPGHFSCT